MPQYVLPDGTTPLSASLEMETGTQIQAIWEAMLALNGAID